MMNLIKFGYVIKIHLNRANLCEYIVFDDIQRCQDFIIDELQKEYPNPIKIEHRWNFKENV